MRRSSPYSKVRYFGVETAGLLDIDSELILAFSNGEKLQFDFKTKEISVQSAMSSPIMFYKNEKHPIQEFLESDVFC